MAVKHHIDFQTQLDILKNPDLDSDLDISDKDLDQMIQEIGDEEPDQDFQPPDFEKLKRNFEPPKFFKPNKKDFRVKESTKPIAQSMQPQPLNLFMSREKQSTLSPNLKAYDYIDKDNNKALEEMGAFRVEYQK
jgi:hypothetical protein